MYIYVRAYVYVHDICIIYTQYIYERDVSRLNIPNHLAYNRA